MQKALFLVIIMAALAGCKSKTAVSTGPARNRYFSVYDSIYRQWGQVPHDSTRAQLELYLQEFPENAQAHHLAGNLAYYRTDYEEALTQYRMAIRLEFDKGIYYSAMGSTFNAMEQPDSTEKYLTRALELGDSSAHTLSITAMAYLKKGNREKALGLASLAWNADSTSAITCSGLSYIYDRLDQPIKSVELLHKATALGLKDTAAFTKVLAGKMKPTDYYRTNY